MSLRPADPRYAADRWDALGSYVSLVVADADRLAAARAGCERILLAIDLACSRFRADSDLVRANAAAGSWVRVDPLLIEAVTLAVQVATQTDGLVDPTLGNHLRALGYDRDLDEIRRSPHVGGAQGVLPPVLTNAWRRIGIDPDGGLLVPEGVSLDLGATAKAFAADLIASSVPELVGTALVISLGGDVAVGLLDENPEHDWRITVAERPQDTVAERPEDTVAERPEDTVAERPHDTVAERPHDTVAETVVLDLGGLATSSTLARRWQRGNSSMHHLLDPRTGLPIDPVWRTASVCAATCLDANAASTAALVLGERAPAWLQGLDLAARLVTTDGAVLRLGGWPEPEVDLAVGLPTDLIASPASNSASNPAPGRVRDAAAKGEPDLEPAR
jgi:FAD:protein FMN transferase